MRLLDWLPRRSNRAAAPHYEREYNDHVANLRRTHPLDEAMSLAVGGLFDLIGERQLSALRDCGLGDGMAVVDLGCGSGRTARQIAKHFPAVSYVGIDVVQDLLDYAATLCPSHYRFIKSAALTLPMPDAWADFVISFSVFTHLYPEESYAYLQDCRRVLKPGGKVALTILEFSIPGNWHIFEHTVAGRKSRTLEHTNTFIERGVIDIWSEHLGFVVEAVINDGGQTLCVLRKPAAAD